MPLTKYHSLLCLITLGSSIAAAALPNGAQIGSGFPGLKLANYHDRFVVFKDTRGTVGEGFLGGWRSRNIESIYDSSRGGSITGQFDPGDHFPAGWAIWQVYPFAPDSGFIREYQVRSHIPLSDAKTRCIIVQPKQQGLEFIDVDLDKLSWSRYGLKFDQHLLGYLNGRVFYWTEGELDRIHWFPEKDRLQIHTKMLPRKAIFFMGVTVGLKGDVCLVMIGKSAGLIRYSPNEQIVLDLTL